jgi:hypothetical protein
MVSLQGVVSDEAISFSGKDCFAEFILSAVEGLAMTLRLNLHAITPSREREPLARGRLYP